MEQYMESVKIQQEYITKMKPVFDQHALFSDETEQYRTPAEPEAGDVVTIRFRTKKNNVDAVYFISKAIRLRMQLAESKNGFDFYCIEIKLSDAPMHYYFEIQSGKVCCYYNALGVTRELQEQYSFHIVPGFRTPDWAKGAVMYQIFVDRFCNGDKTNDVLTNEYCYIKKPSVQVKDWDKVPDHMDVNNFYGGDLQGVMDRLDYLQELGIEVIYLNPIFVSPSNHKYDIQDYDYVDPHFGKIVEDEGELLAPDSMDNSKATRYIKRVTSKKNLEASNAFFIELVEEIHRRGMRIILDGVFNHCGSFNKWLDRECIYEHQKGYEKGAYVSADSPYRSFFKFNNEHSWPYNEFYDGWWGHNTLPKLNYEESEKLKAYIMHVAKKWVSPPYNVDGWRLDVAADLGHSVTYNHAFWKEFRKTVKEANPDAIIIAEHYGDASPWLQGDEWDTVMNYDAFMEPISWFLTGMQKHSDQYRSDLKGNAKCFWDAMRYNSARFCGSSLQVAMNELDNHDHSRFLTRTNGCVGRINTVGAQAADENVNKAVLREAVVMQMTWPGAPTVYYGDEAGVCGFTDPDNRRTYPWGKEDRALIQFYRDMIAVHKKYRVLRTGSLKYHGGGNNWIAYSRFQDDECVLVIVNNNNSNIKLDIPVWEAGISRKTDSSMTRVITSNAVGFSTEEKVYDIAGGELSIELSPLEAVVLCHKAVR